MNFFENVGSSIFFVIRDEGYYRIRFDFRFGFCWSLLLWELRWGYGTLILWTFFAICPRISPYALTPPRLRGQMGPAQALETGCRDGHLEVDRWSVVRWWGQQGYPDFPRRSLPRLLRQDGQDLRQRGQDPCPSVQHQVWAGDRLRWRLHQAPPRRSRPGQIRWRLRVLHHVRSRCLRQWYVIFLRSHS